MSPAHTASVVTMAGFKKKLIILFGVWPHADCRSEADDNPGLVRCGHRRD